MRMMLKSGGEMLIKFLIGNPLVEMYASMDEEWQKYINVGNLFVLIFQKILF